MRTKIRVELACVALSVFAALPVAKATTLPSDTGKGASSIGLSSLPVSMQSGVSATLGREDSRYHASPVTGGFTLANPSARISAEFTPAGARIAQGNATWQMKLLAYGYGDKLSRASAASIVAHENRVEYQRGAVTEWYVNGPIGMEQGFTLSNHPGSSKGAPLTLKIELAGNVTPKVDAGNSSMTLASNGSPALRYSGLTAYDATGNTLKTWMELEGSNLLLHVDDQAAKYPVTVDPYIQSAILTASDAALGDQFGYSVAINTDYAVVGASNQNNTTGAVYVYAAPFKTTGAFTAKLTASNGAIGDGFGNAVSIGTDDTIVVGAPFVNNLEGAAYIYAKPLAGGFKTTSKFTAELTAFDGVAGDALGFSVAVGEHIIVVGAPGFNNFSGSAVTYSNPTLVSTNSYSVRQVDPTGRAGDGFGWAAAAYQYASVIGTPFSVNYTGSAYLFEPNANPNNNNKPTAKFTSSDSTQGDAFGNDVATDGTGSDPSTVVVGAPFHNNQKGVVYIYNKPSTAKGWVTTKTSNAQITSSDSVDFDGFGFSVGLKNGVLGVGAPGFNNFTGKGYVYNKPTSGWATTATSASVLNPVPATVGEGFGWSARVAPTGDVLLGAPSIPPGTSTATAPGNAYVEVP